MNDIRQKLSDNLTRIRARIEAARLRAGRSDLVALVAVTKTVNSDLAALLPPLGVHDLGENRPQELQRKSEKIPEVRWHLIGHLQRNKIERTAPLVTMIHSVDSLRLLEALDSIGMPIRVLLEFNCSGETSKGGFRPAEVESLMEPLLRLKTVQVMGLMTMAAPEDEPERCRPTFVQLRQLRDTLRRGTSLALPELSMGMSNDFEIAIEEGATLIRLGTVLFEGIEE